MYIEQVSIKNFKAIRNMELEFDPEVTLLIGDNGAGKTSVLEAVTIALAGMLKGIKGVPSKNILQSDIHFSLEESGDASSVIHYRTPTEISCTLKNNGQDFHWKRFREDESGSTQTRMQDDGIKKWMRDVLNDSDIILPLLCFQSDARVGQPHRGDFGKVLRKKLNDRRCGYIGCLDYSLDIKGIQEWCLKMELSAFQKRHEIREYRAFKKIVAVFMRKISGLKEEPEIYYSSQLEQLVYREGKDSVPVFNLSAGYQSLLWIVMNLAYRLALLNPERSENLMEAGGIVLIDEIDMHLHPKWQWNIVDALKETFPNVQFILATHSPIVISSCKKARLIMIDEDQEIHYLADAHGYSVQDVLNFRQGTTERPAEIKELSRQFEEAIKEDKLEQAEKVVEEMAEILGNDHADVRSAKDELRLNRWEED